MPTYRVFMTAFGQPGEIRAVDVPDTHDTSQLTTILNNVFHFGQNEFQPKEHPSVSVGDIIEVVEEDETSYHLVKCMGFLLMSDTNIIEFMHSDRVQRQFHPLVTGRKAT